MKYYSLCLLMIGLLLSQKSWSQGGPSCAFVLGKDSPSAQVTSQMLLQDIVSLTLELADLKHQGKLNPILEKSLRKTISEKLQLAESLGVTPAQIANLLKEKQSEKKRKPESQVKSAKMSFPKIEQIDFSALTFAVDGKTLLAYHHKNSDPQTAQSIWQTHAITIESRKTQTVDFAPELSKNVLGPFDVGRTAADELVIKNENGFVVFQQTDIASIRFDKDKRSYIAYAGDRSQTYVINENGRVDSYRGFVYEFDHSFEYGIVMRSGGFEYFDIGMATSLKRLSPTWSVSPSGHTLADSDFGQVYFYSLQNGIHKIREFKSPVHPILKSDNLALFNESDLQSSSRLVRLDLATGEVKTFESARTVLLDENNRWAALSETLPSGALKTHIVDTTLGKIVRSFDLEAQLLVGRKLISSKGIYDIVSGEKLMDFFAFKEWQAVGGSQRFFTVKDESGVQKSLVDLQTYKIYPLLDRASDSIVVNTQENVFAFGRREDRTIELVDVLFLKEFLRP